MKNAMFPPQMVGRVICLVALGLGSFCACGQKLDDGAVPVDAAVDGDATCAPCNLPHATSKCGPNGCEVDTCQEGYGDCSSAEPGCETRLDQRWSCGSCIAECWGPCVDGMCVSECDGGRVDCNGTCADLDTNPEHCGSCDVSCNQTANSLPVCASGMCTLACSSVFLDCNGELPDGCEVNATTDPLNCGTCGHACEPGEICAQGTCELDCGGGTTKCGSACVDTNTDEANCGECDKACAGGQNCVGGLCS